MLFSFPFLLLIAVVAVPLYYQCPARWRPGYLLVISLGFYTAFIPWHTLLLCILIGITHFGARAIPASEDRSVVAVFLVVLSLLLAPLLYFKYYPFLAAALAGMEVPSAWHETSLRLLQPLGLSFVTIRAVGYLIDVHRGALTAERSLLYTALFLSFFPQVAAGPIERFSDFQRNIRSERSFEITQVYDGLFTIAWGLFLKLVVADRLALYVNAVYNPASHVTGVPVILATWLYAFQIYADFAGYTCMAIGLARLFGYESAINFRQPYFSGSISEFWTRWHISLSFWLRDYLFLPISYALHRGPLGRFGSRRARELSIYAIAAIVTMLLCGLWHGAGWTFVAWGGLHGLYLAAGTIRKQLLLRRRIGRSFSASRIPLVVRRIIVFQLVCLAWMVFRAQSLTDAADLFFRAFNYERGLDNLARGVGREEFILSFLLVAAIVVVEWIQQRLSIRAWLFAIRPIPRWVLALLLVCMIEALGVFDRSSGFIYFRF